MFELVTYTPVVNGREFPWLRPILSSLLLLCIMILSVSVLAFLVITVKNLLLLFFIAITLLMAQKFIKDLRLKKKFPILALFPYFTSLLQLVLVAILGLGWVVAPSWITYNTIGVIMAYSAISHNAIPTSNGFLFSGLLFVLAYDIWGVWISGLIVFIVKQLTFIPPLIIIVPKNIFSFGLEPITFIGLGDIMFAGLAIMAARKYGLDQWAIIGFAIGLCLTLLLAISLHTPVPAMLLLTPSILIAILLGSIIRKKQLQW